VLSGENTSAAMPLLLLSIVVVDEHRALESDLLVVCQSWQCNSISQ
jgi:hypothetical protein